MHCSPLLLCSETLAESPPRPSALEVALEGILARRIHGRARTRLRARQPRWQPQINIHSCTHTSKEVESTHNSAAFQTWDATAQHRSSRSESFFGRHPPSLRSAIPFIGHLAAVRAKIPGSWTPRPRAGTTHCPLACCTSPWAFLQQIRSRSPPRALEACLSRQIQGCACTRNQAR